jgi:hypothetical protein
MEKKEIELAEKDEPLAKFNSTLRKKMKIFSMSDSYDIPSM